MPENKAGKFFAAILIAAVIVAGAMIFVGPAPTAPAAAPDGRPQRRLVEYFKNTYPLKG
jgi:hypothetical protein